MINTVESVQNRIKFDIIEETTRSAPAMLATSRGMDAHQERMTAVAIIAVPLHSRKYSGLSALIDECDIELVSQYHWNVQRGRNTFYAIAITKVNGRTRTVRMHRLIASRSDDLFIDHIDGDGLNNTRANLREVTNRENLQRAVYRGGSSCYTGVSFDKNNRKRPWKAYIGIDNGSGPEYLGRFATEEEAAHAYDHALVRFGVTSRFRNFPKTGDELLKSAESVENRVST